MRRADDGLRVVALAVVQQLVGSSGAEAVPGEEGVAAEPIELGQRPQDSVAAGEILRGHSLFPIGIEIGAGGRVPAVARLRELADRLTAELADARRPWRRRRLGS